MDDLNSISAIPASLLALLLVWAIWADVRDDLCRLVSGRNVVLCAIAAWYLLEAVMLPPGLRLYSQAQYNLGLFYVAIALGGFLLGYEFSSGCSLFAQLGEKITFLDDQKWLWRLVVLGAVLGFAPIVYIVGTQFEEVLEGMMGMRATWGGLLGRARYGDARAAFLQLELLVNGVAPFAAILLFGKNRLLVKLICACVVAWPALRAYGSGTRTSMVLSFGCILAVFYWKASAAWRKKMILAALACAPLLYGLMAALVISRTTGTFSWEDRVKAYDAAAFGVGNEMFRELLFITSKVPAATDYLYGYSYYVQLVNPIPRFLWPDKPIMDAGILMANMYGEVSASGEAYLTVAPGLIGEMYLNFGVLGILGLSVLCGWLVKGWDAIPHLFGHSLATMMYYSGGLGVLFVMGRGFSMGALYGLLGLALLAWLIRLWNPHVVDENAHDAGVLPLRQMNQ
jgi:oligosaccharide repeat unit polymerase